MTVDFSQYYDNTDLSISGGLSTAIANGMKVQPTNMRVIANNNNWMWARRNGPVAQSVFGDGPRGKSQWVGGAPGTTVEYETSFEDVAVYYLPADRGQRTYVLSLYVQHAGGASTADADVRVRIAGSTVATITVVQGTGFSQINTEIDNPETAGADMVIQLESYHLRLWSVGLARKRYDNTSGHSDAPLATPFHFMQPGRIASTQPLTDEWINRGLNNVNNLVDTQLHTLGCVTMPIKNGTTVKETSIAAKEYEQNTDYPFASIGAVDSVGNKPHVAAFPITVRYDQTVSLYTYFRAPTGSTARFHFSPNQIVNVAPNTATLPAVGSTYTFTKTDVLLRQGAYHVQVYFDHITSTSDTGRLYSATVVAGPAHTGF